MKNQLLGYTAKPGRTPIYSYGPEFMHFSNSFLTYLPPIFQKFLCSFFPALVMKYVPAVAVYYFPFLSTCP